MRRKFSVVIMTALLVFIIAPAIFCEASADVSAKAAAVYCLETQEFLFEKNADSSLSMASTTKIMTALLTLEYCQQMSDKTVTITKEDVAVEGSSMGLREGDKIRLSDLCAGMLLASGNDAANAAARNISSDFQKAMNTKAAELGMKSTNFVTASGLDDAEHYSTAHDMALLAAAALENKDFLKICSAESMTITYNSGKTVATLTNHNKLLGYVDGCVGVKTGFTKKSGRCLVSAARRNDLTIICVTLNDPDDWNDHSVLFDECFSKVCVYQPQNTTFDLNSTLGKINCVLEDESEIKSFSDSKINEIVYLPRFVYADFSQAVGRIDYIQNDRIICSRRIITSAD